MQSQDAAVWFHFRVLYTRLANVYINAKIHPISFRSKFRTECHRQRCILAGQVSGHSALNEWKWTNSVFFVFCCCCSFSPTEYLSHLRSFTVMTVFGDITD